MQKIAIVSDDFPPHVRGGAGVIAGSEAREFAKRGYDVTVITSVQDQSHAGDFQEEGMHILRIYSNYHPRWRAYMSLYNPQMVARIGQLFREERFDLVHAHNIHEHISYHVLKLAAKSGSKVLLTAHDAMMIVYGKTYPDREANTEHPTYDISPFYSARYARLRFNPIRNLVIRRYLQYCTHIFAVSNALAKVLRRGGISSVEVLHNGIEAKAWRVEPSLIEHFKTEYGLKDKKVIFFGGRLSEAKGGLLAIEYLDAIKRSTPEVVLIAAGHIDSVTKHIQQKAEKAGLSDSIRWLGWLSGPNLIAAYYASDVVLVPSIYLDPFPTVNLEAGACGKAVVATCFGGSREVVINGVTGYIADPRDVTAFGSCIQALLSNESLSKEMGKRAREHVQTNFALSGQIEKIVEKADL